MKLEELSTYEILERKPISEYGSEGVLLSHKKSGARVFLVINDDENKVFTIGFRTPPSDSTGVPHIMEHSTLCGSRKFPVKDPFVELVKGSLNTFLNAMTYPDKTVYPVASCNDADFHNLMDVYMDAVLHPNIYGNEKIFRQEGWHYEAASADDPITVNGVVYSEMKGVYSSPDSVLDACVQQTLYPDTCYGFESGGDPKNIPDLTYEEFLNFHRKFYHPSNSFIYLYGKMDMAEQLKWLDEEYLCHYDRKKVDSVIRTQKPFDQPAEKTTYYSITDDEPEEHRTYLSKSWSLGEKLSPERYYAFSILEYVLLEAPGAPLKEALAKAGIGDDISGSVETSAAQPFFEVVAKNADPEQKDDFLRVIGETLADLAEHGIGARRLSAGINSFEFRLREQDSGRFPRGLIAGLQCFDSWLYDRDPAEYLCFGDAFKFLKENVSTGYFEKLLREALLDNSFAAVVLAVPKKGLSAMEEQKMADRMAEWKKSLSAEEIGKIVRESRELKEYQDAPDSREDLEKIPVLRRDQLKKEPEPLIVSERKIGSNIFLEHEIPSNGIIYLRFIFDTNRIPSADLPWAALLKAILGNIATDQYSLGGLAEETDLATGGITMSLVPYVSASDPEKFQGKMIVSLRVLPEKLSEGMALVSEILLHSKLDDFARVKEVAAETWSRVKMSLSQASHSAAVCRAMAGFAPDKAFEDQTDGIFYDDFLADLMGHIDERKDEVVRKLRETAEHLFTSDNLIVSATADRLLLDQVTGNLRDFLPKFPKGTGTTYPFVWEKKTVREGFRTASKVNYVARCGSFAGKGLPYTGALKILRVILGYNYLWIMVRVKGGAYGVMHGTNRGGRGYFVSYRDPKFMETNKVYEGVVPFLENFEADKRDMTKYVIGTISEMDTPLLPQYKGARGDSAYFTGVTYETLKKEREQVLTAEPADIRALAPYIQAILDTGCFVVIGGAQEVDANRDAFDEVRPLF